MTLDEEYFRQVLCSMRGSDEHPVGAELVNGPVRRSFENSPGLAREFLKTTKLMYVPNAAGILTMEPTFTPNWHRIERVLAKIGRGLFAYHMRRPLRHTSRVDVLSRFGPEKFHLIKEIIEQGSCIGRFNYGNAVNYEGARTNQDCDDTIWLITFYNSYAAAILTVDAASTKTDDTSNK